MPPTKESLGLGNIDNTADKDKSVKYAASAGSATNDGNGQNIANTYLKKSQGTDSLASTDANLYLKATAGKALNDSIDSLLSWIHVGSGFKSVNVQKYDAYIVIVYADNRTDASIGPFYMPYSFIEVDMYEKYFNASYGSRIIQFQVLIPDSNTVRFEITNDTGGDKEIDTIYIYGCNR